MMHSRLRQRATPFLALTALTVSAATVSIRQDSHTIFGGKEVPAVVFENDLYVLKVVPSMGGRILSWVDKDPRRPGGEYVYDGKNETGLLDDRGVLTTSAYDVEILNDGGATASARFSVKEITGVVRTKTLTAYAGNRVLKITHTLTNATDEPLTESSVMWRNMVRPFAGRDEPTYDMAFVTPLRDGINVALWPKKIHLKGNNMYSFANVADNWMGYVERQGRDGLVLWFADGEPPARAYYWTQTHPPYSTFEYSAVRPELAPDASWSTTMYLMLQRGLTGYADVTDRCLVDLEPEVDGSKVTVRTSIAPTTEILDLNDKPVVQTTIADVRGRTVAELPQMTFPRIWIKGNETTNEVETRTVEWTAPREGTYICKQQIFLSGKAHSEYEVPFVVGQPSETAYVRGGATPEKTIAYELDAADARRGYFIGQPLRAGPRRGVFSVELDLARNEYETVPLELVPFVDLGDTALSISDLEGPTTLPRQALRIRCQTPNDDDPNDISGYQLLDTTSIAPARGHRVNIYLTFKTPADMQPGQYQAQFTVRPEHAAPLDLPIHVTVHPVTMPQPAQRLSRMYAYWEMYLIWNEAKPRDGNDAVAVWEHYARDLSEAGVRTINFDPRRGVWRDRNDDGTVSYARMDGLFEIAAKYGFDSVWLSPAAEPAFSDYLRARGFETIIRPLWDEGPLEIPAAQLKAINEAKIARQPHVLGHGALSPMSIDLINTLDGYIDIWSFGGHLVYQAKRWLEADKTTLTAADRFGFYGGGAYLYRVSYDRAMTNGFKAGWLDCAHWTCYCYLRGRPTPPWRAVFVTRDGPISSPGWEGVKDGNDCFEYLKIMQKKIRDLRQAGNADRAEALQQRTDRIIGDRDDSIVKVRYSIFDGVTKADLDTDLASMLAAKKELLAILAELQE